MTTDLNSLLSSIRPATERPTPASAYNFVKNNLVLKSTGDYKDDNEGFDSERIPLPCDNIGELLTAIKKKINFSPSAADTFVIMMACAVSLEIHGPPIWGHIAGASSGLKTTWLQMLGTAYDKCYSTSTFNGLYSGSTVGNVDNSLVPKIQGRVFIIKDLTPLLQADKQLQNTIFGDLRDIYDGSGGKHFNNGQNPQYENVRFVVLTGVTNKIYDFQRSDMGERFIIFNINLHWTDEGRPVYYDADLSGDGNAYDNAFDIMASGLSSDEGTKIDKLEEERRMCWGLYHNLLEYLDDSSEHLRKLAATFKADRTFKTELDALAIWLEHARCVIPVRDSNSRACPAEPHRSILILSKLAMCIGIVTKSDSVTDEIRRLIKNTVFNTGKSYSLEVMNYLASYPMTSKQVLGSQISVAVTRTTQICEHLISIGVIHVVFKNQERGAPFATYSLTDKFRLLADIIGLKEKHIQNHQPQLQQSIPQNFSPDNLNDLFKSLGGVN